MGRQYCLSSRVSKPLLHFCASKPKCYLWAVCKARHYEWTGIYLWEPALFINEGDDIHGLECNDFQCLVVISEVNVVPGNVLCKIFLLLQLEDVVHKELLEVLICNVDAQLLKAGEEQDESPWSSLASAALLSVTCLASALNAFHIQHCHIPQCCDHHHCTLPTSAMQGGIFCCGKDQQQWASWWLNVVE